jgi:hypothetical protein
MAQYYTVFLLGLTGFQIDDRVQTHPATDAWMQDDLYGAQQASSPVLSC